MSSVQEVGQNVRKLKRNLQSKEGDRRETLVTLCFSEVGQTGERLSGLVKSAVLGTLWLELRPVTVTDQPCS